MFIYNSFQDIDSSKPQPRPETGRGRQKDLSFSLPPVLLNPAPSIRTFSHFSFFLFFFPFCPPIGEESAGTQKKNPQLTENKQGKSMGEP